MATSPSDSETSVAQGAPTIESLQAQLKAREAELARAYPGYQSVASLPTLVEENIKAVGIELVSETPATLPAACR